MNPFQAMNESIDAFFGAYTRPKSVVNIEDDGDLFHISNGDSGMSVNYEDAEAIYDQLGLALMARDEA